MSKFEINITENGVSIKTKKTRTLYDSEGSAVEIEEGNQRVAIGVGDFDTPEEFQQGVDNLMSEKFGLTMSQSIGELKAILDNRDKLAVTIEEQKRGISERDARITALQAQLDEVSNARGNSPQG